jgi:hypothetical protein
MSEHEDSENEERTGEGQGPTIRIRTDGGAVEPRP